MSIEPYEAKLRRHTRTHRRLSELCELPGCGAEGEKSDKLELFEAIGWIFVDLTIPYVYFPILNSPLGICGFGYGLIGRNDKPEQKPNKNRELRN